MLLNVFLMCFAMSYGGPKTGRLATCFEIEDEDDDYLDNSFYKNPEGNQQDYMVPAQTGNPFRMRRGDGMKALDRKQLSEVQGALKEIFSGQNAESLFTTESGDLEYPSALLDLDPVTEITPQSFTLGLLSRLNQYKRKIAPTRSVVPATDKKRISQRLLVFPYRTYEKGYRKEYYYEDMNPAFHQGDDMPRIIEEPELLPMGKEELDAKVNKDDDAFRQGDTESNTDPATNPASATSPTTIASPTTTTSPTTTASPTTTTSPTTTPTIVDTTTTTPLDYGTTDNRTFDFETPSTTVSVTIRKTTLSPKFDIPALLDIIANLTYDYETNLTHFVNETLQRWSIPTCPTPTTVTTTTPTTTTVGYDYWENGTGTIMGKCFVCGLEEPGIPFHGYCGDAFAADFLPLTPVDPRARGQLSNFRKYCRYMDIVGSYLNESDPKSLWGRWTGGCGVRWIDLSAMYTQRTCRNRLRAMMGQHFLSKRMMKLEMALQHMEDGCVISPVASLVPMSRGINLYARFHACVCSKSWCNSALMMTPPVFVLFCAVFWHLGIMRHVSVGRISFDDS